MFNTAPLLSSECEEMRTAEVNGGGAVTLVGLLGVITALRFWTFLPFAFEFFYNLVSSVKCFAGNVKHLI